MSDNEFVLLAVIYAAQHPIEAMRVGAAVRRCLVIQAEQEQFCADLKASEEAERKDRLTHPEKYLGR